MFWSHRNVLMSDMLVLWYFFSLYFILRKKFWEVESRQAKNTFFLEIHVSLHIALKLGKIIKIIIKIIKIIWREQLHIEVKGFLLPTRVGERREGNSHCALPSLAASLILPVSQARSIHSENGFWWIWSALRLRRSHSFSYYSKREKLWSTFQVAWRTMWKSQSAVGRKLQTVGCFVMNL